ncbi:SCO4402 family protein [Streptomyces olivoreticuli]|uniref:SCO4402 family protein n=1 Tax=Streptomyces olivoreticuli TaxID=68246 RepID=UPI001F0727A3|nr:barstar family protein [Streptomyces olivoreticuli]
MNLKPRSIQLPEMRAEVITAVRALSDPEYQKRVWVDRQYPSPGYFDDFTLNVNILDDATVLDAPYATIGFTLASDEEAGAMAELAGCLGEVLDAVGAESPDDAFLASPLWEKVVAAAKAALDELTHRGSVPKFLLVAENNDGAEQLLTRCADVDGLFVAPEPAPRERLTFLGCTPQGRLRTIIDQPGPTNGRLGDLCIEVSNDERPVEWWELSNAVVLAHQVNDGNPSLLDIVVEAEVEEPDWGLVELPASPRFELFKGDESLIESCEAVDGLRIARSGPAEVPMTLIGCQPAEPLLATLQESRRGGWAELWALDRTGRPMARRSLDLNIVESGPSVLGGGLIDITFADGPYSPPPLLARPVWAAWYEGIPSTLNQWAQYSPEGRNEWLMLAFHNRTNRGADQSGATYHLDGRFVTDVSSMHCAMGEALAGPGGYFGSGWQAFNDCLGGGFGVAVPFTLIWHDAEIARRSLAGVVYDLEGHLNYFEETVQRLERYGVTVVLR